MWSCLESSKIREFRFCAGYANGWWHPLNTCPREYGAPFSSKTPFLPLKTHLTRSLADKVLPQHLQNTSSSYPQHFHPTQEALSYCTSIPALQTPKAKLQVGKEEVVISCNSGTKLRLENKLNLRFPSFYFRPYYCEKSKSSSLRESFLRILSNWTTLAKFDLFDQKLGLIGVWNILIMW